MVATATAGFDRAKDIDPDSERPDKLIQEAIFTNLNDSMSVTVSESDPVEYPLGDMFAELINRIAALQQEMADFRVEMAAALANLQTQANSLQTQSDTLNQRRNEERWI